MAKFLSQLFTGENFSSLRAADFLFYYGAQILLFFWVSGDTARSLAELSHAFLNLKPFSLPSRKNLIVKNSNLTTSDLSRPRLRVEIRDLGENFERVLEKM